MQGLLSRKYRVSEKYSTALDIWSLGCVVHELLTSEIPFLERDDGDDDMTGLENYMTAREVDFDGLSGYCKGDTEFPTEILQSSQVSKHGIVLVQSLLAAIPTDRASAASALQSPWVTTTGYQSKWHQDIEHGFSELGIDLKIGRDWASKIPRESADIAEILPATADLRDLLNQAMATGNRTTTSMLLKSPSRQAIDNSSVQTRFEQLVLTGQLVSAKTLASVGNIDWANCNLLPMAVKKGFVGVVRFLLKYNANFKAQLGGQTALEIAIESADISMIMLLWGRKKDNYTKPVEYQEIFGVAVERGHAATVKLLWNRTTDVNARKFGTARERPGWTLLQVAAGGGHIDVVDFLLRWGGFSKCARMARHWSYSIASSSREWTLGLSAATFG